MMERKLAHDTQGLQCHQNALLMALSFQIGLPLLVALDGVQVPLVSLEIGSPLKGGSPCWLWVTFAQGALECL